MRVFGSILTVLLFGLGFFLCHGLAAQPSDPTSRLIQGAKREGQMIYYASLGLEDARALTQGFEKKYPFIKTDVFRSGHEKILSRPELAENLEENNRLYEEIFVR